MLLGCALAFGWLGALSLWLQSQSPLAAGALAVLSAWAVALHVHLQRVAPGHDPLLLPLAVLLLAWGALVLTRVAPNFVPRWIIAVSVSSAALALVAAGHDRLRWLRRLKFTWLGIAFALLAATVAFGVNPSGGPARLWLAVGSLFFQPSELLRLLLIAFWAAFLSEPGRSAPPDALVGAAAMWLAAVGLLASQQDLGAAALLLLSFAAMLFLATGRTGIPIALVGAFAVAGVAGYLLSARVALRIDTWLNPALDPQGRSFQIMQSLIATAAGGFFGAGLHQGSPGYVPAVHTDFPFVAVAEEFGLLGSLALLAAFALLCTRAWRTGRDLYGRLLAGGIAASLATQVAVIVGGNLGMLPLTGVTLPFISYGGSSLLAWMVSIGLLLRLSADAPAQPREVSEPPARRRTALASLALFACLALWTAGLMLLRAPPLLARTENPRLIDAERAVLRGEIRASDGSALAASVLATKIEGRPVFSRTYPLPAAAHVAGYYSLRYGVGGLEAFADAPLRGASSPLDVLLHRTQIGTPLTTTLVPAEQLAAAAALDGRIGAAVTLDARSGAVLALASSPAYDPNQLEAAWDSLRTAPNAPLLNRATQALYQPGRLLPWLYRAAPNSFTWDTTDRLGLSRPISFELPTATTPWPSASFSETIGQGELRLTPLHVAVAVARRANPALTSATLIAERASSAANVAPLPAEQFTAVAQIGPRRFVHWDVRVDGYLVRVQALETDQE